MSNPSPPARTPDPIPARAGIGLRAPHYRELLAELPAVGWLEVHSENYFGDGGQPLHYLERARAHYPLSLHGVGLSLGSAHALDREHLRRLAALVRRFEPELVSEHLSWGAVPGRHLNDLLPLPYTEEAVEVLARHVAEAQDFLGVQLLIENVSAYVAFEHSRLHEWEFLAAVAAQSGCALLLDVNNIYVSSQNLGLDAGKYIDSLPLGSVREIHVAGHARNGALLIDDHGSQVCADVWELYRRAVARFGAVPTLVEWDNNIPALEVLVAEARRADGILGEVHGLAA